MEHEGDGDTNCNWCTLNNPQRLDKGNGNLKIRGQVETIQTTALLRSAKVLRRVPKIQGDSNSCKIPSANAGVRDSQ